jgi:radical SAM protein with 4Fe4S-binding SPASM domain
MEGWPPSFVAVSIDGPEAVHDAFRGCAGTFRRALDSIAYFAALVPGGVAAGTTVTTKNFAHLPATFGIVLESGAAQWGLHLPVPEGRAAGRKDLFLSAAQLKHLMRFAAAKRNHFPVTMADEIGYCGYWEPLVRSEPFFCGAGRAQCVVLPDGEVVPCTTLDRSASAGNAVRQPLAEIWESGFADLRRWRPEDKCRSCAYALACRGGCWLQRRHGTACFRSVWHMPRKATAVGLAVCLGLAASNQAIGTKAAEPVRQQVVMSDADAAKAQILQSSIVQWYASQCGGGTNPPNVAQVEADLAKALPDDPGAKYFLRFADGKLPSKIEDRAQGIAAALETQQRSLSLIGLAWRDVTEWCLKGEQPQQRSDAQRQALRDITVRLGKTAEAWRSEIFRDKLDPFLRRHGHYSFMRSKGGRDTKTAVDASLTKLAARQWGDGNVANLSNITEQFLADHPFAETMELKYTLGKGARPQCLRGGKIVEADGTLRIFDMLLVPKQGTEKQATLTFRIYVPLVVALPWQAELTYGDVLRLVHEQNPTAFQWHGPPGGWPMLRSPVVLPELLKQKREVQANRRPAGQAESETQLDRYLLNLYLF